MNFTCPHCGSQQIVTDKARGVLSSYGYIGKFAEMGAYRADSNSLSLRAEAVRCANPDCNKVTVAAVLACGESTPNGTKHVAGSEFFSTHLYPRPQGKPFPVGVPAAMLADYQEAWSIIDLSPKSSATLARRCLQAMIRDFCDIHERTLFHDIEKLEQKLEADELPKGVESETIDAMRALKDVGNIGAHMTQAGAVIVDVDPGEAEALLGLIEMLFADWYVARHKRQKTLTEIQAIAAAKKAAIELAATSDDEPGARSGPINDGEHPG